MRGIAKFAVDEDVSASHNQCSNTMLESLERGVQELISRSQAIRPRTAVTELNKWLREYSLARCQDRFEYLARVTSKPVESALADWKEAFKQQVESTNPQYILRTSALRDLSLSNNRNLIETVLRLMREQPVFDTIQSKEAREWAKKLRDVPTSDHRRDQTSCGAQ